MHTANLIPEANALQESLGRPPVTTQADAEWVLYCWYGEASQEVGAA